ncbi:MAG: FAD-binding oxidoreductase [Sphingobium sp.]|jgi:D-arginine dehydrogenase|nr:FAD-binding oxidoreductase [Sphingobium sp.]MCI1270540.1 FAD-binding oxidoreductase [Sphingobium sp.]MCI1755411.1 FAD-binding oxidoreductase [Sphingobium sp.]MCI2053223.1 FAD-binding oxidoreductase [Sphingobium sp.]
MTHLAAHYDAVIVGAGMAGASLGAELAPHLSVLVVEMEAQPGFHATGRSVAFWSESYGGPQVRPLTLASHDFLSRPEADFADRPFLSPRGALHIGRAEDSAYRDALVAEFADTGLFSGRTAAQLRAAIPGLRDAWTVGLAEPTTCDIDVAALHAAYLRRLRAAGGVLVCTRRFESARAGVDGGWAVRLFGGEEIHTPLLINAAGAWADDAARNSGVSPLGIAPLLRTVVQLRVDPSVPDSLPLVLDLAGGFYFKPVGGGRIWLTPHDERPVAAGDAAPEELDVALAIDRLEQVVDWRVEAVERRWAGLRSFAPDRLPVFGHDAERPGFFWFAGQGGFGIQAAPAAARLAAGLILGSAHSSVAALDPDIYRPERFSACDALPMR